MIQEGEKIGLKEQIAKLMTEKLSDNERKELVEKIKEIILMEDFYERRFISI